MKENTITETGYNSKSSKLFHANWIPYIPYMFFVKTGISALDKNINLINIYLPNTYFARSLYEYHREIKA